MGKCKKYETKKEYKIKLADMKTIQTVAVIILLLFLKSNVKAQCPTSKYGIIPVWPQGWTNTDKTNWYQLMYSKGNGFTQLNFTWAEADNIINSGQLSNYVNFIANLKATYDLKFHLSIKNPSTGVNYVPSAYTGLTFEDTIFTNAFFQFAKTLIDSFAAITDYLSVGVEADIYFKNHPNEIDEFAQLFDTIADYVHLNYPNIKISTAVTVEYGIKTDDTLWQVTKNSSDVLCVTYWPLNNDFTVISTAISDISSDMNTLLLKAGSKPVIIKECGFPSSTLVNSSDSIQANFTREIFLQTMNKPQIVGVEWQFLADFSSSLVNYWASFYQINSAEFKGYIGSLGLMDSVGVAKPAYSVFLQMMDSVCSTSGIKENLTMEKISIYPNPTKGIISIATDRKLLESDFIIFDPLGRQILRDKINREITTIDISSFSTGIYFFQVGPKSKQTFKVIKQ